jgi:NlpC/P60 family
MADHYQIAVGDGHADWSNGQEEFNDTWKNAYDKLRFHRGKGFTIQKRPDAPGPPRKLDELHDLLGPRIKDKPNDTIFEVEAISDQFRLLLRKHEVVDPKAEQLISVEAALKGYPYHLGLMDCSGLVMNAVMKVTGILLPHNADDQYHDTRMLPITGAQAKRGDFVFIDADASGRIHHVATMAGIVTGYPGGPVVWDTEPSDTSTPAGWPTTHLGTGVQIRPMYLPWYCGRIVGYRRLAAINGKP